MKENYTRWCEDCGLDTLHRYLDCEECREAELTCIDICTICGSEIMPDIEEDKDTNDE